MTVGFTNNPESNIYTVGIPPDALRHLGIRHKPCLRFGKIAGSASYIPCIAFK